LKIRRLEKGGRRELDSENLPATWGEKGGGEKKGNEKLV